MGPVKPVYACPEVPNKHLMVPIVLLRKVRPKVVARVNGGGLDEHRGEEDPKGDDMGP